MYYYSLWVLIYLTRVSLLSVLYRRGAVPYLCQPLLLEEAQPGWYKLHSYKTGTFFFATTRCTFLLSHVIVFACSLFLGFEQRCCFRFRLSAADDLLDGCDDSRQHDTTHAHQWQQCAGNKCS